MNVDIGASFTDSVIAAFSKDEEVISSIVKEPIWDKDRRVLLIRMEPRDPENGIELRDTAVEMIRTVRGFNFKAEAQETEIDGKPNYFFKLTLEQ